jgi:hydrogenase maturation protein HypF
VAVTARPVRVRARVEGTVQGVGFRPFAHRLAGELALAGWVGNDEHGVVLEVEGEEAGVRAFLERLARESPPLAAIERVVAEPVPPTGEPGFAIAPSTRGGEPAALVSPDVAPCADCLAELLDPADRRYRYPFVNCTNCGPRFTIVRGVPYDRPLTTMARFAMCDRCRAEYEDPADRRFHAQPNACPACGPRLVLREANGEPLRAADPLGAAVAALLAGRVVGVKGLGGWHLACRAADEAAVAALRARKQREDKPFAVMAGDVEAARALVGLDDGEAALIAARERPIVIARRRPGAPVAAAVAPRSADLGVMLPSTPLHHLLLAAAGEPLVMTSGNRSDEPIAYREDEAPERIGAIADLLLDHDRPIHMRTDDSVVRATSEGPVLLRRSRGYVPAGLTLPIGARRPVLGCGAELKSTFCLAKSDRAWVGHHIGDLRTWETLRAFREGIAHFERLFAVAPAVVAHDLHPDYLSTREALAREDVELVGVQHHHAHLAAALAEHGVTGPAVGAIFDGVGYGLDGTAWGGEILAGDLQGFERAGALRAVPLPGGDRAAREPWRMACAWLVAAGADTSAPPPALAGAVDPERWVQVDRLCRRGAAAAPPTTSMGRLFDAVAALAGLRGVSTYEGQAAAELEAAADPAERGAYAIRVADGPLLRLDPREAVLAAATDAGGGVPAGTISARFHTGLAAATAEACAAVAEARGLDLVVLSGGVFQNRLLLERAADRLHARGLRVLVPRRLPPNDGGISFGQVAVAAARSPGV